MRIIRSPLVLAGLAALGLCAWAIVGTTRDHAPTSIEEADDPAAVARASARPRAGRSASRWTPRSSPSHASDPVEPEASLVEQPNAPYVPPTAGEEEAAADEHAAMLDARLVADSRDSGSVEVEAAVADVLRTDDFTGSTLVDADCRSTICRVEVQLDDEDAHDRFVSAVPTSRPFATSGMIRRLEDIEPPRAVVYFARKGHLL